ncbi:hypothetical protein [Paenibacillus lautus]|uniref:hypothetical protein n=1 Tax=Paenibacillus lautus TaxID=1401 RepID=UPI003D9A0D13
MKKKLSLLVLSLILLLSTSSSIFASPSGFTESELDTIFEKAGTPQELINQMDYYTKLFIVENSGEDFEFSSNSTSLYKFDSTLDTFIEVKETDIQPLGYIPSTDMSLSMYTFNVTVNGVAMKEIYSQFEWLNKPKDFPAGIGKDNLGIALPGGYEIQSGRYACAVQTKLEKNDAWGAASSSRCTNQSPVVNNLYGAVWEFSASQNYLNIYYKGTVKLTARTVSSNPVKRAVSRYSQARENALGNYGVSIGIGAASISYTPKSGSNDTMDADTNW